MNNFALADNMLRIIKELPKRRTRTSSSIPEHFAFMPGDDNKTHGLPIDRDVSNWQSAEIDLRVWETTISTMTFTARVVLILFHSPAERKRLFLNQRISEEILKAALQFSH